MTDKISQVESQVLEQYQSMYGEEFLEGLNILEDLKSTDFDQKQRYLAPYFALLRIPEEEEKEKIRLTLYELEEQIDQEISKRGEERIKFVKKKLGEECLEIEEIKDIVTRKNNGTTPENATEKKPIPENIDLDTWEKCFTLGFALDMMSDTTSKSDRWNREYTRLSQEVKIAQQDCCDCRFHSSCIVFEEIIQPDMKPYFTMKGHAVLVSSRGVITCHHVFQKGLKKKHRFFIRLCRFGDTMTSEVEYIPKLIRIGQIHHLNHCSKDVEYMEKEQLVEPLNDLVYAELVEEDAKKRIPPRILLEYLKIPFVPKYYGDIVYHSFVGILMFDRHIDIGSLYNVIRVYPYLLVYLLRTMRNLFKDSKNPKYDDLRKKTFRAMIKLVDIVKSGPFYEKKGLDFSIADKICMYFDTFLYMPFKDVYKVDRTFLEFVYAAFGVFLHRMFPPLAVSRYFGKSRIFDDKEVLDEIWKEVELGTILTKMGSEEVIKSHLYDDSFFLRSLRERSLRKSEIVLKRKKKTGEEEEEEEEGDESFLDELNEEEKRELFGVGGPEPNEGVSRRSELPFFSHELTQLVIGMGCSGGNVYPVMKKESCDGMCELKSLGMISCGSDVRLSNCFIIWENPDNQRLYKIFVLEQVKKDLQVLSEDYPGNSEMFSLLLQNFEEVMKKTERECCTSIKLGEIED